MRFQVKVASRRMDYANTHAQLNRFEWSNALLRQFSMFTA